jgi:hypothetical protein
MYASSQHRWASTRQNHSSRHCPDSLRSRTRWCSWKRAVPTSSPGGMLVQCRRWDQPERCRPRGGELTCRVGPGAASVIHRIGAVASGQPGRWPCRPWAVRGSRAPVAGSRAPSAERRVRPDRVVVPPPVQGFALDRSGPAPFAGCGSSPGPAAGRGAPLPLQLPQSPFSHGLPGWMNTTVKLGGAGGADIGLGHHPCVLRAEAGVLY